MTDPIADMLTRIRNAILASQKEVSIPHSNLKEQMAKKLSDLGYLESYKVEGDVPAKNIIVFITYKNDQPLISNITRISRPGRRIYSRADKIKPTLSGYGATIISTSAGLLSDKEARQKGVGGEIICKIY